MHHLSPHTLRQRPSSGQLLRNQPVGQLIAGADQDDTCWPVLIPQGSTNHLLGDCKKASLGFCAGLKGNSTIMSPGQYYFMDEVLLTQQGACQNTEISCGRLLAVHIVQRAQRHVQYTRMDPSSASFSPTEFPSIKCRLSVRMGACVMLLWCLLCACTQPVSLISVPCCTQCRTKGDHFCKPAAFPYFTDLDLTGASWTGKTMAPPAHYAMQIGGTKYLEQESQSNHLFATVDVYAGSWTIACNIWKVKQPHVDVLLALNRACVISTDCCM